MTCEAADGDGSKKGDGMFRGRTTTRRSGIRSAITLSLAVGALTVGPAAQADNPIIQTIYSTDPAPMVYNNRVYVYTGQDEDGATTFVMKKWHIYSSADMVNWTDHGSPLSLDSFSWAQRDAWAGQAIYRNGKFYWYVPIWTKTSNRPAIGVAVSDSPTGPFKDAIGRPLVDNGQIDPGVFVDDDGQAYLYMANPGLSYVKLNPDMISTSGSVVNVNLTTSGFGTRPNGGSRPTNFEEGPWVYKRNGIYYNVYAAACCSEFLAYSTGPSATGPWTYRGTVMPTQGSSFTNHPGIVDFKGGSYLFYHNGALPGGGGYQRSVAVEKFTYGGDGSIPSMNMSSSGPPQIETLDPYVRQEAETIAWESGVETEATTGGGVDVAFIDNGDYIKVKGVAFGAGATSFKAQVASAGSGGTIELRLDKVDGTRVGACTVSPTGGWQTWTPTTCSVSGATGTHDLFLRFTGGSGSLFNVDWWQFSGGSVPTTTTTTTTTSPTTTTTSPTTTTTTKTTKTTKTTTTKKTSKKKSSKKKTTSTKKCKNTRKCSRNQNAVAPAFRAAAGPAADGCRATWTTVQSWPGGYSAQVRVEAGATAAASWTVTGLPAGSVRQAWGARVASSSGGVRASGAMGLGDGVTFGYSATGSTGGLPPLTCTAG